MTVFKSPRGRFPRRQAPGTGNGGGRKEGPGPVPSARLPYRKILTDRSVLTVFLLGFSAYWTLGLILTWLPTYLEKGLGFDAIAAGRWFAVVVATTAPVNLGVSWWSQRMLLRGASTRQARVQLISLVVMLGGLLFLVLVGLHLPAVPKVVMFAVAGALPAPCFALAPAILAEVVPECQRGSLVAIHTALASLAAAISPAVMGWLVQTYGSGNTHGYEIGFLAGGVLLIAAALASLRWLHPERSRQTLGHHAATTVSGTSGA